MHWGIRIPAHFRVIPNLAFEAILGLALLQDTHSNIDIGTHTLRLYNGLINVPMTVTGSAAVVYTACNVNLPPRSETVLPLVLPKFFENGDFIIEGELRPPCRSLVVAATLVNPSKRNLQCKVLNPTDAVIKLRTHTPIGSLHRVTVHTPETAPSGGITASTTARDSLSHDEMLDILKNKGINLDNTAVTGQDFEELVAFLYEYGDVMTNDIKELKGCDVTKYYIETGDSLPIRQRGYRLSQEDRAEVNRQIAELEECVIIRKSDSVWASPIVLVTKKGGARRFCCDFRRLNSVSLSTSFPLKTKPEIVDQVATQKPMFWSNIDMTSGYWQLILDERTRHKTAFIGPDALYEWCRLPFGLGGSPQHFAMTMEKVLRGLTSSNILVYSVDDILIVSATPEMMRNNLRAVFDRFRTAGLKINGKKSFFCRSEVTFLGHKWSAGKLQPDDAKFQIIREFKPPRTPKQVKSFLGVTGFYRMFIQGYSIISEPLRHLLRKNVKFKFDDKCQAAFEKLKSALMSHPVLMLPQFDRRMILTTDASYSGMGWTISQIGDDNMEHPLLFGGRALKDSEKNYSVSELELAAIIGTIL